MSVVIYTNNILSVLTALTFTVCLFIDNFYAWRRSRTRDMVKLTVCVCVQRRREALNLRSLVPLASIPGRVFAFITVRQTGTSCLRMCQSFVRF